MERIELQAAAFLRTYCSPLAGKRFLVACSGGKDSMALLGIMALVGKDERFFIEAFHLDHGIRGEESAADARFVEDYCRERSIPCTVIYRDIAALRQGGESLEERARLERYALIDEILIQRGCDFACTAHTLDDQAETVLYRVVSGSGLAGLSGVLPLRGKVVRPLLQVTTRQVLDYLSSAGLPWREDSTNRSSAYRRNLIRHEILPAISRAFPASHRAMARLAGIAEEYRAYIAWRFAESGSAGISGDTVTIHLDRSHPFEVREFIRHAFDRYFSLKISSRALAEIEKNIPVDRSHALLYSRSGVAVRYAHGTLVIGPAPKREGLWETLVTLPVDLGDVSGSAVPLRLALIEKPGPGYGIIDGGVSFVMRNRRPGDSIFFGLGRRKVKDILIGLKLDPSAKDLVPLLLVGGEIAIIFLSVTGIGEDMVSSNFYVEKSLDHEGKKILAIGYTEN